MEQRSLSSSCPARRGNGQGGLNRCTLHLQAPDTLGGSSSVMRGSAGLPEEGGDTSGPLAVVQETTQITNNCSIGDLITGTEASHWRHLLVHDHLNSSSKLALFGACTAARTLVLVTAKRAAINLIVAGSASARAVTVNAAMATRGRRRTKLVLDATHSGSLSTTLGALEESTTWLDELHVRCGCTLSTTVLSSIGRCCPNLRALHISTPQELPSPDVFPKLQELTIQLPPFTMDWIEFPLYFKNLPIMESIFLTTGPYIKQLTHLSFPPPHHALTTFLPLLLNPANVGTHLRTLHLNTILDDTLLGLILQCAPALEELGVRSIQLESDTHAHTHTQWRRLQFSGMTSLISLARLPAAPGMEMCVDRLVLECWIISSDEAAVAAHLQGMRFSISNGAYFGTTRITGVLPLNIYDQPAGLRVGLSLLRSAPVGSDTRMGLELGGGWTMSAELMQELAGLPRWAKLHLSARTWPCQPQVYAPLLSLLPDSYCVLSFSVEHLESEQMESILGAGPIPDRLQIEIIP